MKFNIIISLEVFITFLVILSLGGIQGVSAQQDILTDTDATVYYSNPSEHINKNVNFTGKILTLLPPSSGTLGLQMYQSGDTNRNTIVVYADPLQLSEDDCVRVTGITQPVTEYQNMFGARLSAAAINADSIKKIDCSESIEPARKNINVEQTQEKNNINLTLHKVEFSDKNTRAYLTVENAGTSEDITFHESDSRAIQGKTQFITTNSYDVQYPKIVSTIPAGIEENGVVLFESLDPAQGEAQFRFEARDASYDNIRFIFDVIVSPVEYYKKLLIETNDTETLYNISSTLFDSVNYTEAIEIYDKVLVETNDIETLDDIGNFLYESGNYSEAIKYYDKILLIDPNDLFALNDKSAVLSMLGNYTEVIEFADKVLERYPNHISALGNKGLALYNLGNYTEAIRFADKAVALSPEDVDSLNVKAASYLSLGNYTEALHFADKVLEIDPNYTHALDNKGVVLFKLGNITEAIDITSKAISLDNEYANAWYNRAIYYANENKTDESISDLNQAIMLDKKYGYDVLGDKDFDKIKDNPKFIELLKEFK